MYPDAHLSRRCSLFSKWLLFSGKKFRHFLDTLIFFSIKRRKHPDFSPTWTLFSARFRARPAHTLGKIRSNSPERLRHSEKNVPKSLKFSAPQKTRAVQKQSEKQLKLEFNPPACFDQLLFSRFLFAPPVFTPVADYISLTVCVLRSLSHSGRENADLSLSLSFTHTLTCCA